MAEIIKARCDDTVGQMTAQDTPLEVKLVSAKTDIIIKKGYSPYIGDNGHWYEYDVDTKNFVDTGIPAQGARGTDGNDGYTPIKDIDYFDGERGEKGDDGYTPIKGVDYFDGLVEIMESLPTLTSALKLTIGTLNLNKLSDAQKAIATNKKWTLA